MNNEIERGKELFYQFIRRQNILWDLIDAKIIEEESEAKPLKQNLNSSIIFNLVAGRTRYSNGWSLFTDSHESPLEKNAKIYKVSLLSPNGEKITEIKNLTKFCKNNNLPITSMKDFILGKKKSNEYKGWKLLI
jgi:hypothetical protein